MKKPNILLLQNDKSFFGSNLARLCPVLELISFQVELCTDGNVRQLASSLTQNPPDLVICGRPLRATSAPKSPQHQMPGSSFGCPQLVLSEEGELIGRTDDKTAVSTFPVDVIALHERICRCIDHYPRKHLRMPAHLPCFFSVRGFHSFGEILSLGTGGAFIKGLCHHLRAGDLVDVCIPLLGMKREVEIRSRLVYSVFPKSENNYLQGVGVEFVSPDRETYRLLVDFLRLSLQDEISPVFSCFGLPGPQDMAQNGSAASLASIASLESRMNCRH